MTVWALLACWLLVTGVLCAVSCYIGYRFGLEDGWQEGSADQWNHWQAELDARREPAIVLHLRRPYDWDGGG